MARRSREQTASVSDIGEIPPVVNPERREACRLDLHRFLITYFPRTTGLSPFSSDHVQVINCIQSCYLEGGRYVNAVYRGFAKTTIGENSCIWGKLYGHRTFTVLFGADGPAADESMDSIKSELDGNDLLFEDFPEVCHPIRCLENTPQRAMRQTYRGESTHIEWTAKRIVLPFIPGSLASGGVIVTRGITAGFRGLKKKLPNGSQPRPDFIMPDDPQTDEAASTPLQVAKTLSLFRKGITKLGAHTKPPAIVVNATVIQPDDAIDCLLADPAWQGKRIPMVREWPTAHQTLWLGKYAELRQTYNKDVEQDQLRAHREATEFYRAHREEMDRGAEVSWEHCYDHDTEISAVQHAYNILIDDGEEAFASECQVKPLPRIKRKADDLGPDAVAARLNRSPAEVPPPGTTRITAFIDVGQDLLWYAVAAWSEVFGGGVIRYGAWPDQGRAYVFSSEARPNIRQATGISTPEGSIYAALTALSGDLLGREWGSLKIERCLVDAGWGLSTEVVYRFCRQSPHAAVLLPSKGLGISASMMPMSDWPKKEGERRGDNWVIRSPASGRGRIVLFDANRWKSFTAGRLSQPIGEASSLLLFGEDAAAHRMLADHCCAEYREKTFGRGREVEEWKLPPHRPDNHLWDCLVGAAVAASTLGLSPSGQQAPEKKKPVKWSEVYAAKHGKVG